MRRYFCGGKDRVKTESAHERRTNVVRQRAPSIDHVRTQLHDRTLAQLRISRADSTYLAATSDAVQTDSFLEHAHPQALLEAARLTGLPSTLVNLTVVRCGTGVLDVACGHTRGHERVLGSLAGPYLE